MIQMFRLKLTMVVGKTLGVSKLNNKKHVWL